MTDTLEDLIVKEAQRLGLKPNVEAMRQAAIDLAGSSLTTQNLINLPGKGSISPADFVRSLRSFMPTAFSDLDDKPSPSVEKPVGKTLTQFMREQIDAGRKQAPTPDDWQQVRSKYAAGTLTAKMMDQIEAERRQGNRT